jgi:hypothetical protein
MTTPIFLLIMLELITNISILLLLSKIKSQTQAVQVQSFDSNFVVRLGENWIRPKDTRGLGFCSGCRKEDKKENLLYDTETKLFCHPSCLRR